MFRLVAPPGPGAGPAAAAGRLQRAQRARRRGRRARPWASPARDGGGLGWPTRRRCRAGWSASPEQPCVVLRDYAHTPDALERALADAAPAHAGRADRGLRLRRRSRPGQAARSWVGSRPSSPTSPIVTSDNPADRGPRGRSSTRSRREWARRPTAGWWTGARRSDAALDAARAGDTVLLAGKGHETYQVIGTEKLPFDEREIVRAASGGPRDVAGPSQPWSARRSVCRYRAGRRPTFTANLHRHPHHRARARCSSRSRASASTATTILAAAAAAGATRRGGAAGDAARSPGLRFFEVPDTLRAFGRPGPRPGAASHGPGGRDHRHQRQDQHQGDGRGRAAHPLPHPRHPGQRQQSGRRSADDSRGTPRDRGAGDRGRRQPARGDRPGSGRSSSRRSPCHQRGRRSPGGFRHRWRACSRRSWRWWPDVPLAIVGTEPPALADGGAARGPARGDGGPGRRRGSGTGRGRPSAPSGTPT